MLTKKKKEKKLERSEFNMEIGNKNGKKIDIFRTIVNSMHISFVIF